LSITVRDIIDEVQFKTSRSGGPGGQHVNKVESRVQAIFNLQDSKTLSERQKYLIRKKYDNRLSKDGNLIVSADGMRSQLKNREVALNKLVQLINKAFIKKKRRIPTKPKKGAIQERLKSKKIRSERKKLRSKPNLD